MLFVKLDQKSGLPYQGAHIRKLANLKQKGRTAQPEWKRRMSARHRKSLAVCQTCHQNIHYGKYDGRMLSA